MLGENARYGCQEVGFATCRRSLDDVFRDVDTGVGDPPRLAVHLTETRAQAWRRVKALGDGRPQALNIDRLAESHDFAGMPGHCLVLELQDGDVFMRQWPAGGFT